MVGATGGSTNAGLHLPALAHEAGIRFTMEDVVEIMRRTPYIADLKPSGKYVALDVRAAWTPRKTDYNAGAIWKYAQLVGPAYLGAVTHPGGEAETHCYADIQRSWSAGGLLRVDPALDQWAICI